MCHCHTGKIQARMFEWGTFVMPTSPQCSLNVEDGPFEVMECHEPSMAGDSCTVYVRVEGGLSGGISTDDLRQATDEERLRKPDIYDAPRGDLSRLYEMMKQSAVHQAQYATLYSTTFSDHILVTLSLFDSNSLSLQLGSWEIVLGGDGTWFWRSTSDGANTQQDLSEIYAIMQQSAMYQAQYAANFANCVPVGPRLSSGALSLQLWGWEIVLGGDGTWFDNDTSGG